MLQGYINGQRESTQKQELRSEVVSEPYFKKNYKIST